MKQELEYLLPQCKAVRNDGKPCRLEGLFKGFCAIHWRKELIKKDKEKETKEELIYY
jgi:hypothetical protein